MISKKLALVLFSGNLTSVFDRKSQVQIFYGVNYLIQVFSLKFQSSRVA